MWCSQGCRQLWAAMFFLLAFIIHPVSAEDNTQSVEKTAPVYPEVFTQQAVKDGASSDNTKQPAIGSGVVNADPVTAIAGLVLIVFLIITIGWLIRRVGGVPMMGGQAMKVSAVLSLGGREKVVLVDVGDKQVLLGVAPGRVSHLQSFDEPVIKRTGTQAGEGDFSSTIKNLLQNNKSGGSA